MSAIVLSSRRAAEWIAAPLFACRAERDFVSARQSYNQRLKFTSPLGIVASLGNAQSFGGELNTIGSITEEPKEFKAYSLIRRDIHIMSASRP